MSALGASSAKLLPWSGLAMSTRPTRRLAAPIDSSDPTCAPRAASSRESGQTSPRAGMPPAGAPLAKAASATSTCPRSGYPSLTAATLVSWLASPLNTTDSSPVLRALRSPRRVASAKYC